MRKPVPGSTMPRSDLVLRTNDAGHVVECKLGDVDLLAQGTVTELRLTVGAGGESTLLVTHRVKPRDLKLSHLDVVHILKEQK